MNLYIDCTETYKTKLNTGIQRVVRKVVEFAPGQPIVFDGIGFLPIQPDDLNPKGVQVVKRTREWIVNYPLIYPFAKSVFKFLLRVKTYLNYPKNRNRYIRFKNTDVILSADIVYDSRQVKAFSRLEPPVYQVVYDVLPLSFPKYFPEKSVKSFTTVANRWSEYADGLYAISKKVAKEVHDRFSIQADYFYLGADFYKSTQPAKRIEFGTYFLAVGTIEPRKNHVHILKTFIQLWDSGSDKKLVFIGRKGWKFEEILEWIELAREKYPNQFLWLSDCDDATLEEYYASAEAVICASIDEGFGLPVVEALCRRKSVICSDIEVFREIGSNSCSYFGPNLIGPTSLAQLIESQSYKLAEPGFTWITWEDSVRMLINKIRLKIER